MTAWLRSVTMSVASGPVVAAQLLVEPLEIDGGEHDESDVAISVEQRIGEMNTVSMSKRMNRIATR